MDFEALFQPSANELGFDTALADALHKHLEDVTSTFVEFEDLGIFFFNEERCVDACENLPKDLRDDAAILLWLAVSSVRRGLSGTIWVEFRLLAKTATNPALQPIGAMELRSSPIFGSSIVRPVSFGAVNRLCQALRRRTEICNKFHKKSTKAGKTPSLQARATAIRAKVTSACMELLVMLGPLSGRFVQMYADGQRDPSPKEKEYLLKLFFQSQGRDVKALTIWGYCKEFRGFLEWLTAIGFPFGAISSFHVACWLSDMAGRGSSVPSRCFAALIWRRLSSWLSVTYPMMACVVKARGLLIVPPLSQRVALLLT